MFVGNVNFNATKDELSDFFRDCRAITDIAIILDRNTRQSKGYAFVIFADEDAAKEAVSRMHGQDFQGRPLKVKLADHQDNNRSFKDFDARANKSQHDSGRLSGYGDSWPRSYDGYSGYGHESSRGRLTYDYGYNGGYDYHNDYRRNDQYNYSKGDSYYQGY